MEISMRLLAPIGLLTALASWAFLVMTFQNLLSGHFETRTCLTDCVKNYYFLSAALGLVGAGLASFSIVRSGFTSGQFFSWLLSVSPIAIVAAIFIIGYVGTATH
jgi:hypothetical protein